MCYVSLEGSGETGFGDDLKSFNGTGNATDATGPGENELSALVRLLCRIRKLRKISLYMQKNGGGGERAWIPTLVGSSGRI